MKAIKAKHEKADRKLNANNHLKIELVKRKTQAKAIQFAHDLREMNRGTQMEQNMKPEIIKSMIEKFGLTVREARRFYKEAKK